MLCFQFYFVTGLWNLFKAAGPPICTENCTTLLEVLIIAQINLCVKIHL